MTKTLDFDLSVASSDSDAANSPETLVCTTLRDVARRIETGLDAGAIEDSNGNTIGNWYLDIQDKD